MALTTATAAAILAFNALMANAQVYTCECDGLNAPEWEDCEKIVSTLDADPMYYSAPSDVLPCGFVNPPDGTDPDSLNCVVTYCKNDDVAQGDDILYSDILLWYTSVSSNCRPTHGEPGGKCGPTDSNVNKGKVTVEAKANPNYSASSSRRRDVEPVPLVPGNATRVWAQPPAPKKENEKREHARDFPQNISKRQSPPDSDDTFELFVTSRNVENPNSNVKVFGPAPSGSTYTVSSSRSQTNSISSSASLSVGFFEIFEASVSIDVGYEETVSETEGFSVPIDCPSGQRGVIYWTPLHTYYSGLYQPSGTQVDWYVANGGSQSSYALQCIG